MELAELPKPEWDVLGKRPGYTKTQSRCIDYLKFSLWIKPKFDKAPVTLEQSWWAVSRNFVSADFRGGESEVHVVPLEDSDLKAFHQHVDWGVLEMDKRSANIERQVMDKVAEPLVGATAGAVVGELVVAGFAVSGAAVGATAYGVFALFRDAAIDAYEQSQRALYLGLRARVSTKAYAYRSLIRINHEGRRYVRERYGLLTPDGDVWVTTCYWPQTGINAPFDTLGARLR